MVERPVTVADVQFVARLQVILEPEAAQRGELARIDVQHRDGIVFLQRHPGRLPVLRDGDVLGFEVLRDRGAGAEDPDGRIQDGVVEFIECRGAHVGRRQLRDVVRQVDDADRTLGVDVVGIVRLALVGDQHALAVRGEHQHVGQRADLDCYGKCHGRIRVIARGIEKDHLAGSGLGNGLDRRGGEPLEDGDAVHGPAQVNAEELVGRFGVQHVQHIDLAALGIDHEQALGFRIVRDDLGGGFFENPGRIRADRFDADRERCRGGGGEGRGGDAAGKQGRGQGGLLHQVAPSVWTGEGSRNDRQALFQNGDRFAFLTAIFPGLTPRSFPRRLAFAGTGSSATASGEESRTDLVHSPTGLRAGCARIGKPGRCYRRKPAAGMAAPAIGTDRLLRISSSETERRLWSK
jgi:hypothetical protein